MERESRAISDYRLFSDKLINYLQSLCFSALSAQRCALSALSAQWWLTLCAQCAHHAQRPLISDDAHYLCMSSLFQRSARWLTASLINYAWVLCLNAHLLSAMTHSVAHQLCMSSLSQRSVSVLIRSFAYENVSNANLHMKTFLA